MFEAHVLHLLRRYLGEYVHGLSAEALRISVWKGDVVLKDLKLKAEALNSLRLPVTVKAGFVGTITLKVPWKSLGKEPVIVLIDRVFILAHPVADRRSLKEEDRQKLFEAKLQQIEEAESATLEARSKTGSSAAAGNSWLGSLIATIIGNLKISISNVHIRYEDSLSNPGHPFSCGVTLAKLAAVTMDEQGNETFDASGALDKLRKSLQLESLAMYHDSDRDPWKLEKKWEDLSPEEWIKIFEDGIQESSFESLAASAWARGRNFVVSPINGVLKYHRLGNQERIDPNVPFEKASLTINDVSLTITEAQYYDWIRLMEVISRYQTYVEVSHLRPMVPISKGVCLWWRYAAQAGLQQKKMCLRFSWDQIQHLCHLRRRYVQLYANLLQQSSTDNLEIWDIERDLDPKVILLWRLLAHAKVESVKSKEAADQRMLGSRSWFSFRWRSASGDASAGGISDGTRVVEERFTKEEWEEINKLLSFQPDEDLALLSGKEMQNMIRYLVDVSITRAAARIINISRTEIVCGRFDNLNVSTKFRHRSTSCDVTLKFCGLSSPEGSLAQSVISEQKANALAANFVHTPTGENVDWRLSAKISPCLVTIFMESYNRCMDFITRSNAVSPTLALETATALQNKIEMVTRRAQEQIQTVLEEQSRCALDIDLDAPKVRIPMRPSSSSKCESHFLLDFGHFTLHTKDEDEVYDQIQSLYSRFYISGRDIAAFFTNCGSDSQTCTLSCQPSLSPSLEDDDNIFSLVDRCGMAVIVDQINVHHPSHPSTRVSVEVPSLGIHFSPARYCRLMELLNILCGTLPDAEQPSVEVLQTESSPWIWSVLETEARILVWRGIGYSVAEWQPCFLVLSGIHLYVLESKMSYNYERRASMSGKQVYEVPPTNVGGSPFCIAISARGVDVQKALESFSTLIIEFHDEEEKSTWLRRLIEATYQASAPPSVDILGGLNDNPSNFTQGQITSTAKTADLVVSGTLTETKLSLYGKVKVEERERSEESLIVELLACGGKVHVSRCEVDLTVKVKLHSLKIKDELHRPFSSGPQYLACSVVSDQHPDIVESHAKDLPGATEDDDVFKDALADFMSLHESTEAASPRTEVSKERCVPTEVFYEAEGFDDVDFISLTFLTRDPGSPDYDGIDTQMSISMSKLEFFCNRPTLFALINLGFDSSSENSEGDITSFERVPNNEHLVNRDKIEAHGRDFVKGLLGHGKGRVVFDLNMNVDSVTVFLNKEDGSQLAMFVQESFLLDIKVHPSSISIEGTLGNFRLCDLSLGPDHCWGWLCDIRNQGAESLIQFTFKSYSTEDDDYQGYDYSLSGRLSAVRIVFLYRFVQEVTAYFMELATPHVEEVTKFVEKVGEIEGLIQKYEIEGASALKLDLALDTPIIVVPQNSMSKDFMQLDLGHLRVKNEFYWHGCPEKDPSAVHLDILDAEILGINLAVGVNGCIGKPMIQQGRDIHVYVRRSLRDVFRKVPTFTLEVKVGLLHAVMSDKEYNVILNCLNMNLCEEPFLPPSFHDSKSASKDTMKLLADKVNVNSQVLLSRTVNVIAVEVNYALLELCNGIHEVSPLAHVSLEGLWVSYRMTSLSEADLYVTIPKFSFLDIRADTKPEMRLMIGSCTDVPKQISPESRIDLPNSTMFLMDCRWRSSSQSFVLRVQQPRVLVVPDFLLAVCEIFVPAVGTITGREEKMDPKNDPIVKNNCLLSSPLYKQIDNVMQLSPNRQLIADTIGVDDYVYDGCGKTIILTDEKETKEFHSSGIQPIIVIGRGKRLRFVNVKIENGFLLRRYTYLSSDSSYSVSMEDGVEILFTDNISSSGGKNGQDYTEELPHTSDPSGCTQNEPSTMQSFSFEAQVVSPEFTFYDSSKSYLEDSSHSEKLLRVKMDFSFMYASKENDAWIRGTLKDLTTEAGSGLIILDPVDISGGYTSIKDKTNMSLMSTDIYIHLSLGVISLLLNLQNEATAALEFGNADPLSPCTDFDRIWVSPKENGCNNNITFWRPRAPSSYVILGDCVTSRPNPPSQVVVAIYNAYGRVRRPLGFKLIGSFSSIQELEAVDIDCSLWLPIAPTGYVALGCVAHPGTEQPPLNIVHCIRSDLVTSTYLECIFNVPANPSFLSGFSIWRVDNVLVSFYAHSSFSCPPKDSTFDLNHLLLWNSSWSRSSSSKESSLDQNEHARPNTTTSAGSESLRSTSCCMSTPKLERIWWDRGGDYRKPVSIWRPVACSGFAILGDCITEGLEPPPLGITFKADNHEFSAKPVQFTKVAHIGRTTLDEAFFWYPVAPPGYASLGCVVTRNDDAPQLELVCCPRIDLISEANTPEIPISRSSSSKGPSCWSIWKVENQACTFLARPDLKKPSSKLAFVIGDSVKPKTRDKITAELKIRCFSLSVLDSFCGMMTPLFDATITNIKLATHGRLESMNAVLVSSIAASTFNTQLEAWEPLVEPFDGILKFETYDTNLHPPCKLGKRVRIAAASILNINLSAANIETLVQTTISWKRQRELEQKAFKLIEEARGYDGYGKKSTFSALDENDFQTIILENKLGCDIYLKEAEKNSDEVKLLHHGDYDSVSVPPPRYSDRLNVSNESKDPRRYIALKIVEAKGLPVVDDGNSLNFFCALRLVIENQDTNHQKIFPQNARTKCVKPLISTMNDVNKAIARWNEIFIFEVPWKGMSKLEVEVTNLAAKAGKGEIVGASSFPVGHGSSFLKKVSSLRTLNHTSDVQNVVWYPLRKRGQSHAENTHSCGSLSVSTSYFERKATVNFETDEVGGAGVDADVGFWVGLSARGAWESFRSLLPLSVITKPLSDDVLALEVFMKNGKKHAIFRSLATAINDSDIKLDILVCPESEINSHFVSSETTSYYVVVEEIFENQRYHPVSGWKNNQPAFHSKNPGRWSNRDFSYSSNDYFDPPLPPGWTWTTGWTVDKSQYADNDGWAYGLHYDSFKWPLTSPKFGTKSTPDAVRQRRWTRTRQQVNELDKTNGNNVISVVSPDSSTVLPWRSMCGDANHCLLVRPHFNDSQTSFAWGRLVSLGQQSWTDHGALTQQNTIKPRSEIPVSALRLYQLEKKDELLSCPGTGSKQFWLSIGTDASVLHTELNSPVYDWKISISSPLKLENRLPCPAEFTVRETLKDGNCIDRQHGCILSRETVHIYTAHIQHPIYLMLIVQGGWVVEKDAVLVLDLACNNHVSSFWMVNQQQKRRLRVIIDRDMGGTAVAPKTIRFFVPYWISNDSFLSLAYRVVEIEPVESVNVNSPLPLKRLTSAKSAIKSSSTVEVGTKIGSRKTAQVLEAIEDTNPTPCMLSPQDYIGHNGVMLFSSRNDAYLSPRVGITVAIQNSEKFSPGISLLELEKKQRVDVMAFGSDGSYYKLSALLHMTSDRTKVVHFQPHTMFINRVGFRVCLQQCGTLTENWIHPTDPPKQFGWECTKGELLKLRMDGYEWSAPFSAETEGVISICLKSETGGTQMYVKVKVRSGMKSSRFEVIFRPNSFSSPYRIENRSLFLPVCFRQAGGDNDSWQSLHPNVARSFLWEDLGREKMLELHVDGIEPIVVQKYNIDEIFAQQPILEAGTPGRALRVTILKEEKMNVVKINDWIPENAPHAIWSSSPSRASGASSQSQQSASSSDCEFHVIVEVAELGLSVIDHTPEEILYLSIQNLLLTNSTGLGSGVSRFKITAGGIQVDNQLPLTSMPVLFRPQRIDEENDYILKFSMTQQSNGSLDLSVYPYIGFQGPENSAFLINIHEPIIWRLHEMIQQANPGRFNDNQTTSVSVDPIIEIGVLNISEIRFKLSLAMSPTQRPVGVFGFWSSLMTALGSTENMPVRINPRFLDNVSMRYSVLIGNAISNIKKDLLSQPLQLLSGLDILGNASSALGHMSKGVAALSMDKKFIRSRQRQGSRSVEDFGDVIREGGGALAKGLFRGVTGILTKPLEGAKASGVEGFVQGVGKGLIGAAAQPVSGVLDLLSKTTEGANAVKMKIASAIASEDQLLRRRLPRVISGDNLLRPYDEYKAQGQVILQLAESGSFLGQVHLFKVRGKFALTDAYEDHFPLPKGRIAVVTHRRVILLQQASHVISQKKFNPARDPCSILWDVLWEDLVTMKLTQGKKDQPNGPPSRVHLESKTMETKDQIREIKCNRDGNQATEVHKAIEQARSTYCTSQTKGLLRRKVTKPYAPPVKVVSKEATPATVPRSTTSESSEH